MAAREYGVVKRRREAGRATPSAGRRYGSFQGGLNALRRRHIPPSSLTSCIVAKYVYKT